MTEAQNTYSSRFEAYFAREVAVKAAKSLGDGAEIEFRVTGETPETFTFTKQNGKNHVVSGSAMRPQLIFDLTPKAADKILADPADDVGHIGVGIAKLIFSSDPAERVQLHLKAGFLTLFSKGYFGVVTAGGGAFGSFLASKGFDGIGAIKAALKKLKSD